MEDRVGEDLVTLAEYWKRIPELPAFLTHPRVPVKRKESFIQETLSQDLHPYTVNTLRLMVRRRRGGYLQDLRSAFLSAAEKHGRLVRAVLHVARPVSPKELEMMKDRLREVTGRAVVLEVESAPELIAGAELEVTGQRLDVSLQRRLARLAKELKG